MDKFVGIINWMGFVQYPKLVHYWSTNLLYQKKIIKCIMSRYRFMILLGMWPFSDIEACIKFHGGLSFDSQTKTFEKARNSWTILHGHTKTTQNGNLIILKNFKIYINYLIYYNFVIFQMVNFKAGILIKLFIKLFQKFGLFSHHLYTLTFLLVNLVFFIW